MQSSPRAATSRMARIGHTDTRIYTKVCICRRRFDQQQPAQATARIILQVAPMQHWKAVRCRRWRSHCGGWSRRGKKARRLQWYHAEATDLSKSGSRIEEVATNAAQVVQRACSCCMAPDYQATRHIPCLLHPCLHVTHPYLTIILSETPSYFLLLWGPHPVRMPNPMRMPDPARRATI
jgi:hypothetical protein